MSFAARVPRRWTALVLLTLIVASPARVFAQRVGMPDLTGAPADIQAIWKKVQSGGRPTMDEAQKLGQYLAAHAGQIQNAAKHQADSVRVAAPKTAKLALGSGADPSKVCPTRSPALRTVSSGAITDAASRAFLDSISHKFLARETPAAAQRLEAGFGKTSDAAQLDATAGMLYLAGYDGASIVGHAAAARRGGVDAQRYWANLGATLVSADDPADAVTALRRALAIGTPYPLIVHQLGVAYADLGDLARAESLLTTVTRSAPNFALTWDALARVQSCTGNMTAAWASLAKAQEASWNDRRARELAKHDPESNDDRVEAAKPFAEPTGASIFPSLPAPPPADLSTQTPVLGETWRENLGHPAQFIKAANAYRELAGRILQQADRQTVAAGRAADAVARQAGVKGGDVIVSVALSNDKEVTAGVEKDRYRLSARESMVLQAYADRDSAIMREQLAVQKKREDAYRQCLATSRNSDACKLPYCRAKLADFENYYEKSRDNARVFFGGTVGLGATYDAIMRRWFMRAESPGTRISVDAERRYQLAGMTVTMFTVAIGIGPNDVPGDECFDPQVIAALEALAVKAAAAADPGSCGSIDLSVHAVASISGDCNHVRMTIDLENLPVTPTLDYKRATHDHAGSVFMGGGKEFMHGAVAGEAGLQVNFNEGGWVQGFGPAGSVTVGSDDLVAISANGMINLLNHGPAGQAGIKLDGPGFEMSLATDTGFTGHLDI